MFDFGLVEDGLLFDEIVQPTIIDVFGLHVPPPSLGLAKPYQRGVQPGNPFS
jgi:hypothetical protein